MVSVAKLNEVSDEDGDCKGLTRSFRAAKCVIRDVIKITWGDLFGCIRKPVLKNMTLQSPVTDPTEYKISCLNVLEGTCKFNNFAQ